MSKKDGRRQCFAAMNHEIAIIAGAPAKHCRGNGKGRSILN
jgi:hypothetical protein